MKKILLFTLILLPPCFGFTWNELTEQHNNTIIRHQYLSGSPKIADPKIKEISIEEGDEEFVDLRILNCKRIYMMPDPSFPFEGATYNSGLPNASKMRARVFAGLQIMLQALDELAQDFGYKKGQIDIQLFEGLRDLETQKMLFDQKLEEILRSNPDLTLEMAEQETSKWVSPYKNNVPVHSTGAAIDIRLWDNQNNCFLDMGTFGVIWGPNEHAATFSENIRDDQKLHRLYCLLAAEKAGLTNYSYEFWHFSSGDRYDLYWKQAR